MNQSIKNQNLINQNARFALIFILLFFLSIKTLTAQENKDREPKIGLVLSGGGAKGLAHIGVLKVIDSLGIKVDYIGGTSMGAIMGSLYASGYSGKDLEKIADSTDFEKLIGDQFDREVKSLFERRNKERYIVGLPFDNFSITFPKGLSNGQNVYDLLYQLLLPVRNKTAFKDLPIPFFCVATDISTGQPIIFEEGNLPQVVTASGAIPSIFKPVVIGNQTFTDGGVTNNYPIEELKKKGMDIIIGVDVQDDLRSLEELNSAPEILLQINNFKTINAMKDKKKMTDIYIDPDIEGFNVVSFSQKKQIIKNGELAALKQIEALKNLQKNQVSQPLQKEIKPLDSLKINYIKFNGNEKYTRAYLIGKIKIRGDKKISYKKLLKGIKTLAATNNFESIRYELKPSIDKKGYDFIATVRESKPKTFLKFALHYDDLYNSAALFNLTRKRLLFKNDVASLDLILGDNSRYNFDYFIDKGYYLSLGLSSRYNQFDRNASPNLIVNLDENPQLNLNKLEFEIQDFTNQLYIQTLFTSDMSLQLGFEHKHLRITTETVLQNNQNQLVLEDNDYFSLFGNLKLDTYDNAFFPTSGFFLDANYNFYISSSKSPNLNNFSIAKAKFGYAFRPLDKIALKLETSGGFHTGSNPEKGLDFGFGGYGRNFINNYDSFLGYDYLELTGNSFVKASATVDFNIFKKQHFLFTANMANIGEGIFQNSEWLTAPTYTGYALGYSIETIAGPIEAKYSYSPETNQGIWYFNLGFWF